MAVFDKNKPIGENVHVLKILFSANKPKEDIELPELEGKFIMSVDTIATDNHHMVIIMYYDRNVQDFTVKNVRMC